jgi:NAD(P)-dependent dehydrogenase (short-subunit alcohol dehydrogenase family)
MGMPDDVAEVVSFLCTDAARWIYGQTIVADGGFSLLNPLAAPASETREAASASGSAAIRR